jgi:DNA polymerase-3 subunit gamma/tau
MEKNRNSLYRIYRPNNFNDVAGHKNIVEILQTQLKNNNFSHAFLFSGQRGTGKTSMARIVAKAVNCLNNVDGNPCNQCENCLAFNENQFVDVYEIDAASNNGVDEIRNIKTNILTLPIVGQYKVYIIDEVHMLTKGAFNALLKTLEEPPHHVIFILATTEYDKIPQTIISRCQTFNFKKITALDLKNRLNFIAQKEGYEIEDQVSEEIFNLSEGSLRDALNVLEQLMILSTDQKIKLEALKKVFYLTTKTEKILILQQIFNQETNAVISYFEKAKAQGMDFEIFSLGLIKILKELIEYQLTKNSTFLVELNLDEAKIFSEVSVADLFLITDNLSKAYQALGSTTINFDTLILSTIQSMQKFSQRYHLVNDVVQEEVEVKQAELSEAEKEITIVNFDDHEDEVELLEPTLIDNFLVEEEKKSVEPKELPVEKTLLGLIKIQNELVIEQDQLGTQIKFLMEDLINVLRGAVVDHSISLRKDLSEKIDKLFQTDDQQKLLSPIQANKFLVFYDAKVVVANKNELILNVGDQMLANLINH